MKYFIGIDNGVTGAVGIIAPGFTEYFPMPVRSELDYTKTAHSISRVDVRMLQSRLRCLVPDMNEAVVFIERPMKNPMRFLPTISAMRAFEATLIVLESLKVRYEVIDSKKWQRLLLPKGLKDKALKPASLQTGSRLFPSLAGQFGADADAILIAEYCRKTFMEA